jgi:hypothetical protein
VSEVPTLAGEDEAAHELTVDPLGPPACGASSAADTPGCDDGAKVLTRAAMLGTGVLGVSGLAGDVAAALRAEPRVRGEGLVLTAAEVAAAGAERDAAEDSTGGTPASTARVAEGRVSVAWVEATPTAGTWLYLGQCGSVIYSRIYRGPSCSIFVNRGEK